MTAQAIFCQYRANVAIKPNIGPSRWDHAHASREEVQKFDSFGRHWAFSGKLMQRQD
jgi:hypothetical protein